VTRKQDRQCKHKLNTEARSCNYCSNGTVICITYFVCVYVAFGTQHAMHMRHSSSVTCPALQYSSALSHKRHDFRRKKSLLNIKRVFWFSLHFPETFLILRTQRDDHKCISVFMYEGKSLNNRNAILKCMKNYAQGKILFWDTNWLLSNMSYRGRDDQAV
jgi:hypothetical protein